MKKMRPLKLDHNTTVILTAVVAILVLIIVFNSTTIQNYFRGISQAAVINITDEVAVLHEIARQDELADFSEHGLAYLSLNTSNINDTQVRYYDFATANSAIAAIGNVGDFSSIKTNGTYLIYIKGFKVYWHDLTGNPFDSHTIPKLPTESDKLCDIGSNNKIIFVRTANSATNLWQYDIVTGITTQLTSLHSDKKDINYYYDETAGDEKIVWADDRNGDLDIYLYDFATPDPNGNQITTDTSDQYEPIIYQNKIVWTDTRNGDLNLDIYMRDLSDSGTTDQQITFDTKNQRSAAIYKDVIVWEDLRNDVSTGLLTGNADIYMYDLHKLQEYVVSAAPPSDPMTGDQLRPQILRNKIIWTYAHGVSPGQPPFGYASPNKDVFMSTFDKLDLIAPDDGTSFNFTDITMQWDYSSDNPLTPVFYIRALLDGVPFTPLSGIKIWSQTFFTLKSTRIETFPDGIFTWSVLPATLNVNPDNWALAESRTIIKKTAADLLSPPDNTEVVLGTKFDWSDIPNANLYIAKIGNYLPGGKFLYLPLSGSISELTIAQNIYDLLKPISGEKTYTWTVSGTKLPTPTDWQKIWYGPTRTFKVKA